MNVMPLTARKIANFSVKITNSLDRSSSSLARVLPFTRQCARQNSCQHEEAWSGDPDRMRFARGDYVQFEAVPRWWLQVAFAQDGYG